MLQVKNNQAGQTNSEKTCWEAMCRVAGLGVLAAVGLMLLDIVLSFGGGDVPTGAFSAVDWFGQFQTSPLLGLRNLGFFNVINPILTLPLYLVVVHIHRRRSPSFTVMALFLMLLGMAVYIANNRALTMLSLSSQYAAATSEAQRSLLATAGTVILAQAEDFTPGSFVGFFLQSFANLMILVVMLRGGFVRRWVSWIGLVGSACLFVFTVSVTFAPSVFDLAMLFALVGGLLMLAWNIVMALSMFRLGQGSSQKIKQPTALEALHPSEKGV